jgi:serine/threonine protein kinase
MTIAAGCHLGPYEVVAPIGAGGMGEVYRARGTRLGRDVAIKVLRAEFAADPERLRRFEQEARAVAALNHPNILALYDVGTHEGAPYLVTELLEGESLRERLSGGAMPVRKAIEVSIQIAQGLAAGFPSEVKSMTLTRVDGGLDKAVGPEDSLAEIQREA